MKPGSGSKQKGSTFERKVCKDLSLWVSFGAKQDLFWRSAMSGGRATVAGRKGIDLARQAGDITAVAPEGHQLTDKFYIECKHLASLDLARLIRRTGKLSGILAVAWKEANRYGRQPLVIAKQNRTPTLVVTTIRGAKALNAETDIAMTLPPLTGTTNLGNIVFLWYDALLLRRWPT